MEVAGGCWAETLLVMMMMPSALSDVSFLELSAMLGRAEAADW